MPKTPFKTHKTAYKIKKSVRLKKLAVKYLVLNFGDFFITV